MPKKVIPLTTRKIEQVKAIDKVQYFFDGNGLYLHVAELKHNKDGKALPSSKLWKFKYTFQGKEYKLAFGSFPVVSLDEAREKRQEALNMIANGINPSEARKQQKADIERKQAIEQNTFANVAMQWYQTTKNQWSKGHAETILGRLNRDVLPQLGRYLISEVTRKDVLNAIRVVEERQALETAHRINSIIRQVFDYALIVGAPDVENNPAVNLSRAIKKPIKKNMPAITEPERLGTLLKSIDAYAGSFVVKYALKLAPLWFLRSGELRNSEWRDIDFDAAVLKVPMNNMKLTKAEKEARQGQCHTVPLSRQAIQLLQELHPYTGHGKYVFAGRTASRVISENTLNAALRTMGYGKDEVVVHGFRATARTLLHEVLKFSPDAIEAQLGHTVPDRLGTAYNRTKHLEERTRMMQAWSDYLDKLKDHAAGVPQRN